MEKEDIIRMAREAWNEAGEGWVVEGWFKDREKAFERFAQLVAAAEREACAKVCDPTNERSDWTEYATTKAECAAAIRARGQH